MTKLRDRVRTVMVLIAILMVILGLLSIFAKDLVWELTAFGNRLEGKASERTDTWDVGTTVSGVIFIVLGIVLFFTL
jgi:uncharacterized membrane protein HdeD (DUF308 family)